MKNCSTIIFCYLALASCQGQDKQTAIEIHREAAIPDSVPSNLIPSADPQQNWIYVEQAVDAWLFFNLSDFKSYEPIIRSTDYNSETGLYTHHLRYRSMNPEGGMQTSVADFEVDLSKSGDEKIPFSVTLLQSNIIADPL